MAASIIRPKFVFTPSRATLSALKGVNVIDRPIPHDPGVVAVVFLTARHAEIRQDSGSFSAAVHLRYGEWLPLAAGVSEDGAYGAVAAFALRVADVPYAYSEENDAAEREAAAEIHAAFTAPVETPMAA